MIVRWILLSQLLFAIGVPAFAQEKTALIVGASFSSGLIINSYKSPTVMLAEVGGYKADRVAQNMAKSGKMAPKILKRLEQTGPVEMILGIDLFFHDTLFPDQDLPEKSMALIQALCENSKFLIIGEPFDPFKEPGEPDKDKTLFTRAAVTAAVAQCGHAFLLKLEKFHGELFSDQGYHYNLDGIDTWLKSDDTMFDVMHPKKKGMPYIANVLIEEIRKHYEEFKDYPYVKIPTK